MKGRAASWLLLTLLGCASAPVYEPPPCASFGAPSAHASASARPTLAPDAPAARVEDETIARLRREAQGVEPLVGSALAKDFLRAVPTLPPVAERVLRRDASKEHYYAEKDYAALTPEATTGLTLEKGSSDLFYETHYGTPIAYARALDVAGEAGVTSVRGKRILDYGYGTVGHLRLLSANGADAVGVDVDPFLAALYSDPSDVGRFPPGAADAGTVSLVNGRWPGDKSASAGVGGGFQVFLSKNVLKNGYLHPAEPVPPRQRFDLGVADAAFVKAVRDALVPGGIMLIYNISPKPAAPGEKYRPHADGRCPFPRAMLEKAGFEVLAFDQDDGPKMRAIAKAFKWDEAMGDLDTNLFALYTLARRKP